MYQKDSSPTKTEHKFSIFDSFTQDDLATEHTIKCISENGAVQMCLNGYCYQNNKFLCFNQNCPCRILHQDCKKGNLKTAIKMINAKISNTSSLVQLIDQVIDKKIDELSEFRQNLIKISQNEFKYFHLNLLEKKLLGLNKDQEKASEFTSAELKYMWQSLSSCDGIKQNILNKISSQLKNLSSFITRDIQKFDQKIKNIIEIKRNKDKNIKIAIQKKISPLKAQIMMASAVCTTEFQVESLLMVFQKQIKRLDRLFCASHHNFSIKKYLEMYGKEKNTLVICKTNNDKIIGGFSPLPHYDQKNYGNLEDTQGDSFIFSLTDMEKFTIDRNTVADFRNLSKDQIFFGMNELRIFNKFNKNPNYLDFHLETEILYFPGCYHSNFSSELILRRNLPQIMTAIAWQVWKVEFDT